MAAGTMLKETAEIGLVAVFLLPRSPLTATRTLFRSEKRILVRIFFITLYGYGVGIVWLHCMVSFIIW